MSYVIHIWQTPIPTSVLQADKICDRLQETEGRQNPKFIELAKRLTQRYSCRNQMTGDQDDEEGVWLDEPLDGISPNPVIALGIRSEYVIEVMPFVAETANALGLTVYDTQVGECYLPSGQVLGTLRQESECFDGQASAELICSPGHLIETAAEYSEEYYKKYGFKYSHKNTSYIKKYDDFYFRIQLWGGEGQLGVTHEICITKGLHLFPYPRFLNTAKPEPALRFSLIAIKFDHSKIWPCVSSPFDPQKRGITIRAESVAAVKEAMDKTIAFDDQTIMFVLSKIKNLQDINQFMNNPDFASPQHLSGQFPINEITRLVVAYLTKTDTLKERTTEIRNFFSSGWVDSSYCELFEKTVELIRLEKTV